MSRVVIYADFNNADAEGRVRLTGAGSVNDLGRLGVRLHEGLALMVHDEELAAEGTVEYSALEHTWAVRIDWSQVRPWHTEPATTIDALL